MRQAFSGQHEETRPKTPGRNEGRGVRTRAGCPLRRQASACRHLPIRRRKRLRTHKSALLPFALSGYLGKGGTRQTWLSDVLPDESTAKTSMSPWPRRW